MSAICFRDILNHDVWDHIRKYLGYPGRLVCTYDNYTIGSTALANGYIGLATERVDSLVWTAEDIETALRAGHISLAKKIATRLGIVDAIKCSAFIEGLVHANARKTQSPRQVIGYAFKCLANLHRVTQIVDAMIALAEDYPTEFVAVMKSYPVSAGTSYLVLRLLRSTHIELSNLAWKFVEYGAPAPGIPRRKIDVTDAFEYATTDERQYIAQTFSLSLVSKIVGGLIDTQPSLAEEMYSMLGCYAKQSVMSQMKQHVGKSFESTRWIYSKWPELVHSIDESMIVSMESAVWVRRNCRDALPLVNNWFIAQGTGSLYSLDDILYAGWPCNYKIVRDRIDCTYSAAKFAQAIGLILNRDSVFASMIAAGAESVIEELASDYPTLAATAETAFYENIDNITPRIAAALLPLIHTRPVTFVTVSYSNAKIVEVVAKYCIVRAIVVQFGLIGRFAVYQYPGHPMHVSVSTRTELIALRKSGFRKHIIHELCDGDNHWIIDELSVPELVFASTYSGMLGAISRRLAKLPLGEYCCPTSVLALVPRFNIEALKKVQRVSNTTIRDCLNDRWIFHVIRKFRQIGVEPRLVPEYTTFDQYTHTLHWDKIEYSMYWNLPTWSNPIEYVTSMCLKGTQYEYTPTCNCDDLTIDMIIA